MEGASWDAGAGCLNLSDVIRSALPPTRLQWAVTPRTTASSASVRPLLLAAHSFCVMCVCVYRRIWPCCQCTPTSGARTSSWMRSSPSAPRCPCPCGSSGLWPSSCGRSESAWCVRARDNARVLGFPLCGIHCGAQYEPASLPVPERTLPLTSMHSITAPMQARRSMQWTHPRWARRS